MRNQPNSSTWFMIIFYFLTDLWFLTVAIMAVKELVGEPYINPLGWSIALPIVTLVLSAIWIVILWRGAFARSLRPSSSKDVSSMNLTDYQSWTTVGLYSVILYLLYLSVSLIFYSARYDDSQPKTRNDFATSQASQVWILSNLLLVSILSMVCMFFHTIASWKYWSLVWSSGDRSLFKNPFYPEKTVIFQTRKE